MTEKKINDGNKKAIVWTIVIIAIILFLSSAPLYRLHMAVLALKICIVLASFLFFYVYTRKREGNYIDALTGVVLLSFSPYQLYLAFEKSDLTDMFLWILILLFATVTLIIVDSIKEKRIGKSIVYSLINVFILVGMTVFIFLSCISKSALSFTEKGYAFGEIFTSFFYKDDHPGFGIALFLAVALWIYYKSTNIRIREKKDDYVFFVLAIVFMILSSVNRRWDSTFFFGLSSFCFSIPAVMGLSNVRKSKNEFASKILPMLILFFAVSVGMFLISQYMY